MKSPEHYVNQWNYWHGAPLFNVLEFVANIQADAREEPVAILRRNLASLRSDVNLKGQINQQRHDDYIEACRICGVEP